LKIKEVISTPLQTPPEPPASSPPKNSIFLPVGVLLVILGVLLPVSFKEVAQVMELGSLKPAVLIGSDLLRLGAGIGIGFIFIGMFRNRKRKQQQPSSDK
jgi:hypothetical protein